jgi:hypothetical protein
MADDAASAFMPDPRGRGCVLSRKTAGVLVNHLANSLLRSASSVRDAFAWSPGSSSSRRSPASTTPRFGASFPSGFALYEYLLPLSLEHPEFRRFLAARGWLKARGHGR